MAATRSAGWRVNALGFAICATLLHSCEQSPKLQPRPKAPVSERDLVKASPIIAVGRTVSEESAGPVIESSGIRMRLQRVRATIENTLRGPVSPGDGTFYYFAWAGGVPPSGVPLNKIEPGSRSIFLLDREGGALRSAVDVYNSQIAVDSGRHPGLTAANPDTILENIAGILLIPGEDVDPRAFARSLSASRYHAIELIGRTETVKLVLPLLKNAEPSIRAEACLVLASEAYGLDDCLTDMIRDPQAGADTKRRARDQVAVNVDRDREMRKAFAGDPAEWLKRESRSTSSDDQADLLRLLTYDPAPEIHGRACELLASGYPRESGYGCR